VLAAALPRIEAAPGTAVDGVVSVRHDPMDAIEETCMTPTTTRSVRSLRRVAEGWLHIDLPNHVADLGLRDATVGSLRGTGEPGA
jgi:hypothetical protein